MNFLTTAGALTQGARVRLTTRTDKPQFARDPEGAYRVAVVLDVDSTGRRRTVRTDLGDIETGPGSRVLLAPAEGEPEPAQPEPALSVSVTVDAVGRLLPSSVLTFGEREIEVPDGPVAAFRLGAVLDELGLTQASPWAMNEAGVMVASVSCV